MRPTVRIAALAAVAAASPGAQQPFEGAITVRMSEMQQTDMRYFMRRGMVRAEITGRQGRVMTTIVDPRMQSMTMLLPEQQAYLRRPLTPPAGPITKDPPRAPTVVRTGRSEMIAGVPCEHVTIRGEAGETDACVTSSIAQFPAMGVLGYRGRGAATWRGDLNAQQLGFPLEVVREGRTVWEVTKVERRALDPSLFTGPAGWRETQLPLGPSDGRVRGSIPPGSRPPAR